jgi:exodeoxyribonuclease VII large subunit
VLSRRYPLAQVLLSPTPVQGPDAGPAIVDALTRLFLDGRSDVIIVARGGGSMEELWPFNEEAVARAIYASPIPVISAVGHETDFTIADFVADLRAPTPSAAAELVAPHKAALRQEVDANLERLHSVFSDQNAQRRYRLSRLVSDLDYRIPDFATLRRRVDDLSQRSSTATTAFLTLRNGETASFLARLQTLNPAATLARGYAVVHKQRDGQPIYSKKGVKAGDNLSVIVSDGAFPASVQGPQPPVRRRRKAAPKAVARLFP